MFFLLLILLVFAVFIEGTLTTIPLTLICLLCLMIVRRDAMIFPLAFLAGLLVDAMTLRPLGSTSLFLLTFVFLILLYQRKYEIYSYQFVMVASFVGSIVFMTLFGYENVVLQSLLSAIIGGIIFGFIKLTSRQFKFSV